MLFLGVTVYVNY